MKPKQGLRNLILLLLAGIVCIPVFMLLTGSLMGLDELKHNLSPIFSQESQKISWGIFPLYPTLQHYLELLLDSPDYYIVFMNSVIITIAVLTGQIIIGVPSAWAFARFRFPGRTFLFTVYIILMIMPFQVTMLSQYILLDSLHLMNTRFSVILPAIFSTVPVFIMYRGFCTIPQGLLEAAKIDGAGEFRTFWKVGLPLGSSGILSALVLGFLEYWGMIEQPLAFFKNQAIWPLALYLPEIKLETIGFSFAASVVSLIPPVFVFLLGQDYLEKGIIASAIKE